MSEGHCEKFIVYLDDSLEGRLPENCLELKTLTSPSNINPCSANIKEYYDSTDSPTTQVAKFIRNLKSERKSVSIHSRGFESTSRKKPTKDNDKMTNSTKLSVENEKLIDNDSTCVSMFSF